MCRAWLYLAFASVLLAQDAREIVRKSADLDQSNQSKLKDYTWVAREKERSFDASGKVKSEKAEAWETVILYGKAQRRMLERNGKPLSPDEQRKEQKKLEKEAANLANESPEQRQHRLDRQEKDRREEREFLLEVADAYDFRIEGTEPVDGHPAWVISATPKPGYQPKRRDAKVLSKVKGKIWIDQQEYQWVRLEAETTDTLSFGLFLARLHAGAKLFFEQRRVNDEIWLPSRSYVSGSARVGLVKQFRMDQELLWTNYKKFQVESKIVPSQ